MSAPYPWLVAPPLLLLLAACTPPDEGEDPAEHACEELGSSVGTITAVATRGDITEAEEIEADGQPWLVELVPSEAGFVGIHVDEDTEAILWTDTANVVAALYLDDVEQSLPTPGPSEVCPEDIPEHFPLELEAGAWSLELGPSAVSEVWILLTGSAGHGHEQ